MPRQLSFIRFTFGAACSLVLCFGLQAFAYYGLGWKTGKGESNYFSTLARFQAAGHPAAEIAFVGSSITGRLPGREVGNANVANLGSDGGPALDGLRMLVAGTIALPRFLVIETNTLYGGVGYGESLMARSRHGPWFALGARCPLLGASARPTAMGYARLSRRPRVLEGESFAVTQTQISSVEMSEVSKQEWQRFHDYADAITTLQKRGVRVILVQMPSGAMQGRDKQLIEWSIYEMQKRYRIPYIDLQQQIPRTQLHFTDAVHLAPDSAARVMHTIRMFCQNHTDTSR